MNVPRDSLLKISNRLDLYVFICTNQWGNVWNFFPSLVSHDGCRNASRRNACMSTCQWIPKGYSQANALHQRQIILLETTSSIHWNDRGAKSPDGIIEKRSVGLVRQQAGIGQFCWEGWLILKLSEIEWGLSHIWDLLANIISYFYRFHSSEENWDVHHDGSHQFVNNRCHYFFSTNSISFLFSITRLARLPAMCDRWALNEGQGMKGNYSYRNKFDD